MFEGCTPTRPDMKSTQHSIQNGQSPMNTKLHRLFSLIALLAVSFAVPVTSLAIDSGSDGSDGALSFPASAGTIVFDPVALGLDPDGDLIFHFTTIDIPSGTTVRLTSNEMGEGRPVIWLATGDVTIDGVLNLDGSTGHALNATTQVRAAAGAGGYVGGLGQSTTGPATAGNGPGGGMPLAGSRGAGGGHRDRGFRDQQTSDFGGIAYGNRFQLPPTGGSGGSGGSLISGVSAAGGGGGGGSITIASSGSIIFSSTADIFARGGNGGSAPQIQAYLGGGGAGGSVRLVADVISGAPDIDVRGGFGVGNSTLNRGGHGWIRIEALTPTFMSTADLDPLASYGHPGPILLPASAPQVRVTQVGTDLVTNPSTGSFETPDVTIDEAVPVTITLEANRVPIGTTISVTVRAEDGATVNLTSTPLAGTFETSTATAGPVTLPHGFTRFTVHATFSP